ncbi:hypothetical protein AAMO2058_001378100 [Amorphochlora amoebiformis]
MLEQNRGQAVFCKLDRANNCTPTGRGELGEGSSSGLSLTTLPRRSPNNPARLPNVQQSTTPQTSNNTFLLNALSSPILPSQLRYMRWGYSQWSIGLGVLLALGVLCSHHIVPHIRQIFGGYIEGRGSYSPLVIKPTLNYSKFSNYAHSKFSNYAHKKNNPPKTNTTNQPIFQPQHEPKIASDTPNIKSQHSRDTPKTHFTPTTPHPPHPPTSLPTPPKLKPKPVVESDCAAWNCTCQGLSEKYHVIHYARSFGQAPPQAVRFWAKNKCRTNPKPITFRPPKAKKPLDDKILKSSKGKICYFVPTRSADDPKAIVLKKSWGRGLNQTFFLVTSDPESTQNSIDFEKQVINVAHRSYRDSHGEIIKGYDPEFIHVHGKICVKMMKFWEYLSSTFDDVWASRCSWFVRTDDDTWMNTRLLERRLRCINPDKELSVGFTNKAWGIGIFTSYSRAWIRSFAYFIRTFRGWAGTVWMQNDVDDRRLQQVVNSFGLWTRRIVYNNGSDFYTNIDGHTSDPNVINHQVQFAKSLTTDQLACLTFFHAARPHVMQALTKTIEAYVEDNAKTGKGVCDKHWKGKGMDQFVRLKIHEGCPSSRS